MRDEPGARRLATGGQRVELFLAERAPPHLGAVELAVEVAAGCRVARDDEGSRSPSPGAIGAAPRTSERPGIATIGESRLLYELRTGAW